MTLSSYDPNARYRRRSARQITNAMMLCIFLGIIFTLGYWVGGMQAQQNLYILEQEKRILQEEERETQSQMTELRAEAQTATVRLEQLRVSYEELLSDGPMQDMVTLLRQQLDKGIDVTRLKSVLLSARPPQNCTDPQSKRFVVRAPVYKGPGSNVSINGNTVSIFGNGVSVQRNGGKKEAWFDPNQPVELTFKTKDGREDKKKGVLPIYHSIVVKDKEYRFTVAVGAKSFARVTHDHCDYP